MCSAPGHSPPSVPGRLILCFRIPLVLPMGRLQRHQRHQSDPHWGGGWEALDWPCPLTEALYSSCHFRNYLLPLDLDVGSTSAPPPQHPANTFIKWPLFSPPSLVWPWLSHGNWCCQLCQQLEIRYGLSILLSGPTIPGPVTVTPSSKPQGATLSPRSFPKSLSFHHIPSELSSPSTSLCTLLASLSVGYWCLLDKRTSDDSP